MQVTVRSRDWAKYFFLLHDRRKEVLAWKKGLAPFPEELYRVTVAVINRYLSGFDLVTVPVPSFHDYSNYPIWELVKKLQRECGFELEKLFPDHSGKSVKHYSGWRQKQVQDISLKPGLFVLVIDDIVTTGNTMRISFEAIVRKGSFPCGIALA